jgi:hypothetical protein
MRRRDTAGNRSLKVGNECRRPFVVLGTLLVVAPGTIRSHFKTLSARTEVHERFAVVLFALERGLIALPWGTLSWV